jgi:hypothetical protein
MTTKTYVTFFYPGSFFPETSIREVAERSLTPDEIPNGCYAYRFHSQVEGTLDGEKVVGSPKDYSGMFYIGEVLTLEQVKEKYPTNKILISNIEGNGWDVVVRTRLGNFQPLSQGDKVISPEKLKL